MNYLGLDYHKKYSYATIITEDGEVKEKEKLLNFCSALGGLVLHPRHKGS
jgi:hypothetical protein